MVIKQGQRVKDVTWASAGEHSPVAVALQQLCSHLRKMAHCDTWADKCDSCSEVYLTRVLGLKQQNWLCFLNEEPLTDENYPKKCRRDHSKCESGQARR